MFRVNMSKVSLEPRNSYKNPLVSLLFAPQNIGPFSIHFFVRATDFLISPLNLKVVAGENGENAQYKRQIIAC